MLESRLAQSATPNECERSVDFAGEGLQYARDAGLAADRDRRGLGEMVNEVKETADAPE